MDAHQSNRQIKLMRVMDCVIAAVLLILSGAVLASTFDATLFPMIENRFERQAVLAPRLLLGTVTLLSAVMLVRGIIGRGPKRSAEVDLQDRAGWGRMLGAVFATMATAALMPILGFLLAVSTGTFVLGAIMGYRRWVTLALVSLLAPLIGWALIVFVAELSLPRGALENLIIRG